MALLVHLSYDHYHAFHSLKDVLEVEPRNGNVTANLGIVYFDLDRDAEAEEYFKLTLDITPGDKQTLYNLALLMTRIDRYHFICLAPFRVPNESL